MVLYARDIMKKYTTMLPGDITALEAAKIMANDHVGFAIVHQNGELKGIVTEWDYVSKVVAKELDPSKVKLSEIMTQGVISATPPDTPTDKITQIMSANNIRRLPPIVENGKLVGVITSRDILRIFRDYMDNLSEIISRFGTF
ncbi:CBS domain-containing protein [Thermogymnomonas acidicola]|uniref:CBS domain-containing protein n=1 Tax=Thermogymnomonas acidicola TaxID=399579 RepID=UPI0009462401|nr:CBS domain-containing protein [Thermogymnomonas acidicola]